MSGGGKLAEGIKNNKMITPRQQQVLDLLLNHKTVKEIAIELGISHSGVWFHVKKLFAHYQVRSSRALFLKAKGLPCLKNQSS